MLFASFLGAAQGWWHRARRQVRWPSASPSLSPLRRLRRWHSVVPIRTLGERHCARIQAHLCALGPQARYLRFGHAATDAQIAQYVRGIDFVRDEVFGIFNRRIELIAVAHLARMPDAVAPPFQAGGATAEFGVSVLRAARGRGFGTRLFARAVLHARNAGIGTLFIHALSENVAMLKIVRRAGATVRRDGGESDCWLELPAPDFDSRVAEFASDRVAEADYRFKHRALQLRALLHGVQKVRRGVRAARHRSAP